MRAIQTIYNGYRFRSRLEARWAVFFDALDVHYEYEVEGFEFEDGTRYLPDFWLPHLKLWLEIKGMLTWKKKKYDEWEWTFSPELELVQKFRDAQEWPIACIVGTPGNERIYFYGWDMTDSSGGTYCGDDSFWCSSNGVITLNVDNSHRDREFYSDWLMGERMPQFEYPKTHGYALESVNTALRTARQARFEFGETG